MISLGGASGDGSNCGQNEMASHDKSNGYEEVAAEFVDGRGRAVGGIGAATVAEWSQALPRAAALLDLGCGTGVPISQVLIERGCLVHAVDAAPTLVAAFRDRFPGVPVECAAVEESDFLENSLKVSWPAGFSSCSMPRRNIGSSRKSRVRCEAAGSCYLRLQGKVVRGATV
jgi:Methyltransferase domain